MQFSYENYAAQQATKKSNTTQAPTGSRVHFINEWLKNDGDVVVVRFPYKSMNDMEFETTHTVTFPGSKIGKRVRCEGDNCPLCKQGVKVDTRFFVKAIVYATDSETGKISLVPAIWDRPAAFADIELKGLMDDYGDLTDCLFKIKRNGTGLETRYTMNIITNKVVYSPEVYKKDFSSLEGIDAAKVLTKSIEQYMKALNPESETSEVDSTSIEKVIPNKEAEEKIESALGMTSSKPVYEEVTPKKEEPEVTTTSTGRNRYTF